MAIGLTPLVRAQGARRGAPVHGRPDVIGGYSSTQIVIKLNEAARGRVRAFLGGGPFTRNADPREGLNRRFRTAATEWRVSRIRPAYPGPFSDPALAAKYGLDRTYIIDVPVGTDTPAMATAFAELDEDVEIASIDAIGGVSQLIPDDFHFPKQYAMHNTGDRPGSIPDADIDGPEAWDIHTGDLGTVTIAIIDSGVDSHLDYGTNAPPYPNGRIVEGHNSADAYYEVCFEGPRDSDRCCPDANLKDRGLCVLGFCEGGTRDGQECCPSGTCKPFTADECPHGTHVAGIAAATGNNGVGVAGVSWGGNIMPVRVLQTLNACSGSASALAAGIVWAADNGADIENFSLQYGLSSSQALTVGDAVNYAHELGVLLISATGNNNSCGAGNVCFPARLQNCMAVGGTTAADLTPTYLNDGWVSNYGPETDLCAPGDDIYSTWISNGYKYSSGTSMATPHVSGLAALIMSYAPDLTNDEVEDILTTTVDDLGFVDWDEEYGYGRINAHRALLAAAVWPTIHDSTPAHRAIDARQHMDSNGFETFGYQSIDMVFPVDVVPTLTPADFTVSRRGVLATAPSVVSVTPISADTVRVTLDSMIDVGAWTTISHSYTGIVRVGFLPGDVNASKKSDADDVLALVDELDGTGDALPPWSTDINRSGALTPVDLLATLDLLNGADVFERFLDETLP